MKRQKKLIILLAALFILIETAAVFYAVYSVRAERAEAYTPVQVVRLGILPDVSKKYSRKFWNSFLKMFEEQDKRFVIEPFIAHSYSELLTGFTNGSLDIIFVNPTTYNKLNEEYELSSIAFQRLTEDDQDKNRCVLLTNKPVEFLNQTKDLRMTFVDKFSLSGYIIPYHTLNKKLHPETIEQWYSDVFYAPTKSQAFIDMRNGHTDVIATDRLSLMRIIDYLQYSESNLTELWVSRPLPPSLLCCFTGYAEQKKEIIDSIKRIIGKRMREEKEIDSSRISFDLTEKHHTYNKQLAGLTSYLEQLKAGPRRSNVLMKIGGEQ